MRDAGGGEAEVATMSMLTRAKIESARPSYFIAFLKAFSDYCAGHDLWLDESRAEGDLDEWMRRLYRALCAPDAHRPRALRDAIRRVAHLSDEEGYERLITTLQAEHDTIDVLLGQHLTALELALWAHDVHPTAFDRAARRKQIDLTDSFWEFLPAARGPLTATSRPETSAWLAERVAERYRRRGQTGLAQVAVETTPVSTRLLLMHGRASRAPSVIDEQEQRARTRFSPERCDVAIIDHRTGRLGVHAETPASAHFLRDLLGEALFDRADHYRRSDIYSGQPLLDDGPRALSVAELPSLRRVDLRAVTIEFADGDRATLRSPRCVFDRNQQGMREAARRPGARVTEMTFAVVPEQDGRERVLEIAGTNWIAMTSSMPERAAREFLRLRGLADYGSERSPYPYEDAA